MASEEPAGEWDWATLSRLVHETKVQVLEALLWIGRPLSATDLENVFDGSPEHGLVFYHMKRLINAGILECAGARQVRGATERFYWVKGACRDDRGVG
jgi:hypothetical protein